MTQFDFDLFVIGGGSGGVRAARGAAEHGARVCLAEEYRIGGTCVIRGCVPKKLMVYASQFRQELNDAIGFGWTVPVATFDWPTFISRKDNEIRRLEDIYSANLKRSKVRIMKAHAAFVDSHTLKLSTGESITSKHILIATGGTPNHGAAIPGIEHVISSNEVFHLPEQPRRILIQGGGFIALEFACIFAGLGSKVIVVYRGDNVLRGFDDDVRSRLRSELEAAGVSILTQRNVTGIEKLTSGYSAKLSDGDGESIVVDQVMFALGRHPNMARLELEEAGVLTDPLNGSILVDRWSQTSVPHIYAVGDVTNRVNLTPVAIREGQAFADTVFGNRTVAVDHIDVAVAVFTQPEVGVVGLTEAQAKAEFARVDIFKVEFRPMRATISGRQTRAMMKIVVDASTDRVVGCHIVGPGASEIIQIVGVAVKMKAKKADFDATMAVHPTMAEELVTMRKATASFIGDKVSAVAVAN